MNICKLSQIADMLDGAYYWPIPIADLIIGATLIIWCYFLKSKYTDINSLELAELGDEPYMSLTSAQ